VDPVTVSVTIDRPREEVFEYLADIANHPEFSDHYLEKWRLTRTDSFGVGAGARYRLKRRFNRYAWEDITLVDASGPTASSASAAAASSTGSRPTARGSSLRLTGWHPGQYTTETVPGHAFGPLSEAWGFRGWVKRKSAKALKRLRVILEDGEERGTRATVAGL
jgi:hypothetical protein